jgi:ketosteroid isomerase-like protein
MESQVLEAYERLVSAFREGRWDDKFVCFAPEATVVDGAQWFGSLDEYRSAWEQWVAKQQDGSAILSVDTSVMKLHMLGDVAVLVHSIHLRQQTNEGEETAHERETIVFAKQPDGRWLIVHQHLSPQPD